MSDIKRWAFSVCTILIASGIFMRILPEKSDKKAVRFVVTLMLIVCIFELDISAVSNTLDLNKNYDNNIEVSEYENKLNEQIEDKVVTEIEKKISDEIKKYDKNAKISVEITGEKIIVTIISTQLSDYEKTKIRTRIKTDFGDETELIYRE